MYIEDEKYDVGARGIPMGNSFTDLIIFNVLSFCALAVVIYTQGTPPSILISVNRSLKTDK